MILNANYESKINLNYLMCNVKKTKPVKAGVVLI
jgi:hypothetical protein